MISDIHEALGNIDQHIDNINELLPGLSEEEVEDLLMQIRAAESHLEQLHDSLSEIDMNDENVA